MIVLIHLHVHTDGSILDGGSNIKKLVNRAVELGMPALGITDHGNMINALTFQEECIKQHIKPIIGCEFYVGELETSDKFHLVLLAKNQQGLKNLYALNTKSYMENFYSKPRITWDMLIQHHEGLICTTACLGSEFARCAEIDMMSLINNYRQLFGMDFYLELQPNSIPSQKEYNRKLVVASEALMIPLIATCDVHYVLESDFNSHDTLLCMQTGKKKDDSNRFKFSCNDFYLKSKDEIWDELSEINISDENIANAICNTHFIARKCNALIEINQQLLPKMIGITNEDKALRDLCNVGYVRRLNEGHFAGMDLNVVVNRIFYELSVISQKGYAGYFLIEEDFLQEAIRRGIDVGKGRGSACGSEVAFIIGITGIEPIKHGLLFERFLNPERNSPPDIDNDFDYERREEMIQYMKDKYGADHIAHIIAKGTLSTVSVIRKVLTAYGYEPMEVNRVARMFRDYKDKHKNADVMELFCNVPEFNHYMSNKDNEYVDMLNLENLISHTSKHAAGVALCSDPIYEHVPCMRDSDDPTMLMTQWDKHDLETVGIYKFDFLGLKTLTIIRKTLDNIYKNKGIRITKEDMGRIDVNDPNLYTFLNNFELCGMN